MIFWFAALASNPHPSRAWRIPRVGHCVHLRSDCIVHLHSFLERNVHLRSFFEFLATYETQMNAIERCVHFKWTQMNAVNVAFTWKECKWTHERCVHLKRTFAQPWCTVQKNMLNHAKQAKEAKQSTIFFQKSMFRPQKWPKKGLFGGEKRFKKGKKLDNWTKPSKNE